MGPFTFYNSNNQLFQEEGPVLDLIKSCSKQKDLSQSIRIHDNVIKTGLLMKSIAIGNALVNLYVRCGALRKAKHVFNELTTRNTVSFNALITGFHQQGYSEQALLLFEQMRCECIHPDAVTFSSIFTVCGGLRAVKKGKFIHAEIMHDMLFYKDKVLGTSLVDMYAKCGLLSKAQYVFEHLLAHDAITWTSLLSGYVQHGHGERAINCFERMQCEGICPDAFTFLCFLKACGITGTKSKGIATHVKVRHGLLKKHKVLENAIVDMYAKFGDLTRAKHVFHELSNKDVVSWTSLISGYCQSGHCHEALNCFDWMQGEGILLDLVTFSSLLKACGNAIALEKGIRFHALLIIDPSFSKDNTLGVSLLNMYAKCGDLTKAQEVFDELAIQDVVSWNALITGYAQRSHYNEALECLEQMQYQGITPNGVTYACILRAYGCVGAVERYNHIHDEIIKQGLIRKSAVVGTALLEIYTKSGEFVKALEVFDQLHVKDVVSWTVLISGYAQYERCEEAFKCFQHMQSEGVSPDIPTFLTLSKACGSTGAIEFGEVLHAEIARVDLQDKHALLGHSLVDMYAKCGHILKAQEVFNEFPVHDVVAWTSLITGYAQLGNHECVSELFRQMLGEGTEPDQIIFTVVLNSCSFSGLLSEGQTYFEAISSSYGMIPSLEHHTCMVDLFGRTGNLNEAIAFVDKIPSSNYLPTWFALLSAGQKFGSLKVGKMAFEKAVNLDPHMVQENAP